MPNYSYECLDCNNIFERRLTIEDMKKGGIICSKCGNSNTKRLFNGFSFCGSTSSYENNSNSCSVCHGGNCSTCKH
ncbi:MAG: zinc ribbon domain-containing protein [Atribacterota bacterium]|nr:zinc ribbon domain-containing protein [Atribacterota bacterium]MDD3031120.1 zinc ribbon domain-containing protein [Atribacterota bacterium]MDD3640506.1 zinc ribbon domain-containing protein [Atribacterota bacterium]MDD4288894.1 zinc ribbon domain-containing protein [Atribacterota bacterium]MDD4764519.1 zinc ribbon domain-containing protein [Atribacterota bacterium]